MTTTRQPPHRRDPAKWKEQVRAANRARYRAVQQLITLHPDDFDRLYSAQAAVEGVTPKPKVTDPVEIQAEIARLQTKLKLLTMKDGVDD